MNAQQRRKQARAELRELIAHNVLGYSYQHIQNSKKVLSHNIRPLSRARYTMRLQWQIAQNTKATTTAQRNPDAVYYRDDAHAREIIGAPPKRESRYMLDAFFKRLAGREE